MNWRRRSWVALGLLAASLTSGCQCRTENGPAPSVGVAAIPPATASPPVVPGKRPPSADFESLGAEDLPGGSELGCRATRTGHWLRLTCPAQHPKLGQLTRFSITRGAHPDQSLILPQPTAATGTTPPASTRATSAELITPYVRGTFFVAELVWGETREKLELVWPKEKVTPSSVGRFTLVEAPSAAK